MEEQKSVENTSKSESNSLNIRIPKINNKFINKKTITLAGILILLGLGAYFLKGLVVAAVVNGQPIPRAEVIQELEKQAGKQTLENIIERSLIKQEARKKGVLATKADIDIKIAEIESNLSAQGATLEQVLTSQGITMDEAREQISYQVELEKLIDQNIEVTDEEVQSFIDDNQIKDVTDEIRTQIKEQIIRQKQSDQVDNLLTRLREEAKVIYFKKY